MGGRRVAGSRCLRDWRAGPYPPPHEDVDHPPKGVGAVGSPCPGLGWALCPRTSPSYLWTGLCREAKGLGGRLHPPVPQPATTRLPEETGLPVQWTQCYETPGSELDLGAGEARQEVAEMWATPGRLPEISAEPGLQPHRCMCPP